MKIRRILFVAACLCIGGGLYLSYKYNEPVNKQYRIHNKYTEISGKSGQTVTYYFYLGDNEEKQVTRITYNNFDKGDLVSFTEYTNKYDNLMFWLFFVGVGSLIVSFTLLLEYLLS